MKNDSVSRSWFCVFNNPEEHGFSGAPDEIVERMKDCWIDGNPQRSCAVTYCISADGLKHCHAVFEDTKAMRFTIVQKLFPGMHIEPTKGSKEQAEDYINKRGKWEEKGESILCTVRDGEIKGKQGARKDFEAIEDLIQEGKTPNEIMDMSFSYRRYDKMIREAYYYRRFSQTPLQRDVSVYWHVGHSGSGKSYTFVKLSEQYGEDQVYMLTDYEHGFDKYNGEPILFMDEFRGQMRFSQFLNLIDHYKIQVPCRYSNIYALWNEVHITSVLPPERVYENMVQDNRHLDTIDQLARRISFVVYHWIDEDGKYREFHQPMKEYSDYETLKELAENSLVEALPEFDIFAEDSSPTETQGKQLDFTETE